MIDSHFQTVRDHGTFSLLAALPLLTFLGTTTTAQVTQTTASPTSYPTPSGTIKHEGINSYTTYYQGTGPIIFLSTHGGSLKPDSIPERSDGCYTSNGDPECNWTPNCGTTNNDECEAKVSADSGTYEIAHCLLSKTLLNTGTSTLTPHLIVNELHRSRLDANRQQEEAAQSNSEALQAWNEIHIDTFQATSEHGWVYQAKQIANNKCGWGLMIDVHGQAKNDYNQFGYRLLKHHLDYVDDKISGIGSYTSQYYKTRSSIEWLVDNNRQSNDNDYADIVRGANSLGSILEGYKTGNNGNNVDYKVVPSISVPNASSTPDGDIYYYAGGFDLKYHGSSSVNQVDDNDGEYYTPNVKSGLNVDVIQIEVNQDIRKNQNGADREQFCDDFSDAILDFVQYWYDTACDL